VSVLVVDKPRGPSSFGVVRSVRAALGRRWGRSARALKVGHGGTLDPMATGVLPLCIGEATKLAAFLLDADKVYEAELRFGVETDTLDAEGAVTATAPVDLNAAQVEAALERFRGDIDQVPPMYAALKREGRPLYDYARAGQEVERAPRRVTVHELALLEWQGPDRARLRVRCSKGTYVRVLAADLGRTLGPGAHLTGLRRLGSGPFQIAAAVTLSELLDRITSGAPLPFVSCADALAHLPSLTVDEATAYALRRGQRVTWPDLARAPLVRVLGEDGALVAVVARGADGEVEIRRGFGADRTPDDAEGPKKPVSQVDYTSVS
jgi:tRNA pseudouridine55 synthase